MAMQIRLLIFLLALGASLHAGTPPLRDCTLAAPLSALSLTEAELRPYVKGDRAVLRTRGIIMPPAAGKNIEARPTGDNSTAFRVAVNYHRALFSGDVDEIASYWHPAERARVKAHFSRPGVVESAQQMFRRLQNIDLLGLLMIGDREVIFIRYTKTTMPFVCVAIDGDYFLVSDPSLKVPTAIASAAFDSGSATMAPPG